MFVHLSDERISSSNDDHVWEKYLPDNLIMPVSVLEAVSFEHASYELFSEWNCVDMAAPDFITIFLFGAFDRWWFIDRPSHVCC